MVPYDYNEAEKFLFSGNIVTILISFNNSCVGGANKPTEAGVNKPIVLPIL